MKINGRTLHVLPLKFQSDISLTLFSEGKKVTEVTDVTFQLIVKNKVGFEFILPQIII